MYSTCCYVCTSKGWDKPCKAVTKGFRYRKLCIECLLHLPTKTTICTYLIRDQHTNPSAAQPVGQSMRRCDNCIL